MIYRLTLLLTQLATATAVWAALEGFAWVEQGYGVHPVLAGALTSALLIVPHLIPRSFRYDR